MRHIHRPLGTRRGDAASSSTPRKVLQTTAGSASSTSVSVAVEENHGNG